jgi:predicted NAD-dependent protein-ADP-ribosyltransferase YbiA (DUF1768 family)
MKLHPEIPQHTTAINIASNSSNMIEALLSNLAHTPFELDGMRYASVEAFWQGLKYSDTAKRNSHQKRVETQEIIRQSSFISEKDTILVEQNTEN